jgi:formamidopyrimidine-DNA glycosylase
MPELPEVEIYCRYFARHALHQRVAKVRVLDERILGETRKASFVRTLTGATFTRVQRHGKNLFADAGRAWLHLHFGMTGDLAYYDSDAPRFARVIFDFDDNKHLAFEDMRLFGVADLTPSPDAYILEHRLGPDPLAMTLRDFRRIIEGRRGAIKALLMSQDVIAGIGNLYADEMLYQSSIHPRLSADKLNAPEVTQLYKTMRRILRDAIKWRVSDVAYPARYLFDHREEGERCPRCGGTIEKTVVFGRTTYYCRVHQPLH